MSTPLNILTEKYHATKAILDSIKEAILAEVLKEGAPVNLPTAVVPLHAAQVKPATAKVAVQSGKPAKRGKKSTLPPLYYPHLSKDNPIAIKDLVKLLNVKYSNAIAFMKAQVGKGLVIKKGSKYTLTNSGVVFKEQLASGGDTSTSETVATETTEKTKPADKSNKTSKPVRFGKPQKATNAKIMDSAAKGQTRGEKIIAVLTDAKGKSLSPKDIAAAIGTTSNAASVWLGKNIGDGGKVKKMGAGLYTLA